MVDAGDDLGSREREKVVVAAQVTAMPGEALAPEVALLQALPLDHGAHGAIQHDDALPQHVLEALDARTARAFIRRLDRERRGGGACAARGLVIRARRGGLRGVRRAVSAGTHIVCTAAATATRCGRIPRAWQMA